jgi:hypothetical protein
MKKFQDLMIFSLTEDDFRIGGKNIIVEIDESKFRKIKNWWIVGRVERTVKKKCFFVIAENRDNKTLKQIIKKHVKIGSIIHTDH